MVVNEPTDGRQVCPVSEKHQHTAHWPCTWCPLVLMSPQFTEVYCPSEIRLGVGGSSPTSSMKRLKFVTGWIQHKYYYLCLNTTKLWTSQMVCTLYYQPILLNGMNIKTNIKCRILLPKILRNAIHPWKFHQAESIQNNTIYFFLKHRIFILLDNSI